MCPPLSCVQSCKSCSGHELKNKGVHGCVNTSAAAGTSFLIQFVTCDKWSPPSNAVATRIIVINNPCPNGESFCFGACYNLTCEAVAKLRSDYNEVTVVKPPLLTLLRPGVVLSSSPAMTNQSMFLQFGSPAPMSLSPCANASNPVGCAAVAIDPVGMRGGVGEGP